MHPLNAMVNGVESLVEDAVVPATDLGLLRGDGAFEVVEVRDGFAIGLREHLARLERSCAALRLEIDSEVVWAEVRRFVEGLPRGRWNVRVLVTRSGSRVLLQEIIPELPNEISLLLVPHSPTPLLEGVKSLSYAGNCLGRRIAQEHGADDALLYSPLNNHILEGPMAAFAWVQGGSLFTPPLSEGILDSITRRMMIRALGAQERPCDIDGLARAEGACILGTGIGVVPVKRILGVVEFASISRVIFDLMCAVEKEVLVISD